MQDDRAFLFSLEQIGIKLGLEQIRSLLAALERPDRGFPSIVVAGTNGKGSTTAMIERGLRAAGYRTGRYTSPHLERIEERFAINGAEISAEEFNRAAARVRRASDRLPAPPTFFEATTALALDVFRQAAVEIAVLEVGLGGRLDATNAVEAAASVITRVDFDHEQYLGRTLEAIAGEKAGIIKRGQAVVLGANPPTVEQVVHNTCVVHEAQLVRAWQVEQDVRLVDGLTTLRLSTPVRTYGPLTLGLRGRHQVENAVTATRLLETIDASCLVRVPAAAIQTALEEVVWPGRLELIETPLGSVLLDGAHNPSGARTLAVYLEEAFGRRLPFVLGMMSDKDLEGIVSRLSPSASHFVVTSATSTRAASPEALASVVSRVAPDVPVVIEPDPSAALARARTFSGPVVVAGSLYLVGEIRGLL